MTQTLAITKHAEGGGNDTEFEAAFANLAYAHMREKAPGLLDYMLGFQLIERDDENFKAVGVFGFKVGSQRLYAPVFYVKGRMKGNELLYLADQDMVVPQSEKWINYIINRKPMPVGDRVSRNGREVGVSYPSLDRLRNAPGKYASDMPEWLLPGLVGLAKILTTKVAAHDDSALGAFLSKAGLKVTERLVKTAMAYPQFAQTLERMGRMPVIAEAIRNAKATAVKQASILTLPEPKPKTVSGSVLKAIEDPPQHKTGGLVILTYSATMDLDSPLVSSLSDDEKSQLLRDSYLIVDKRDDGSVSKAYRLQADQSLSSPTETGIYDVFLKPGEFAKCVILHQPITAHKAATGCFVIRLDTENGDHPYFSAKVSDVLVAKQYPASEWKSWVDGLPASQALTYGARYAAISPNGRVSGIFRVNSKQGKDGGYDVYFESCDFNAGRDYPSCNLSGSESVALGRPASSRIRALGGTLYVPESAKLFKVEGPEEWMTREPPERRKIRMQPGSLTDLDFSLREKTASLKVYCDGSEVMLNGGERQRPQAAVFTLMRDHGFRQDVAESLLKQADAAVGNTETFYVKYASPFLGNSHQSPQFPEPVMGTNPLADTGVPAQYSQEELTPVDGMLTAEPGDYNQLDPQAVQQVMQAAETGSDEAFDVSAISELLDTDEDRMIAESMGRLMGGMDELGRMLMQVYWRPDQFAERYGKSDLPKIEDAMRQTFEKLGTIVLQLKQKQITGDPAMELADIDIGGAAE